MTPSSGFYGLLHPAGQGAMAHLDASVLPSAESATRPVWGAAWGDAGAAGWLEVGRIGLAWTGEIYTASELCRHLDLPNATPLAQLLLAAWRRWSLDFLPRLDGVFALALRDGDRLILSRDPSGLRNL